MNSAIEIDDDVSDDIEVTPEKALQKKKWLHKSAAVNNTTQITSTSNETTPFAIKINMTPI